MCWSCFHWRCQAVSCGAARKAGNNTAEYTKSQRRAPKGEHPFSQYHSINHKQILQCSSQENLKTAMLPSPKLTPWSKLVSPPPTNKRTPLGRRGVFGGGNLLLLLPVLMLSKAMM